MALDFVIFLAEGEVIGIGAFMGKTRRVKVRMWSPGNEKKVIRPDHKKLHMSEVVAGIVRSRQLRDATPRPGRANSAAKGVGCELSHPGRDGAGESAPSVVAGSRSRRPYAGLA